MSHLAMETPLSGGGVGAFRARNESRGMNEGRIHPHPTKRKRRCLGLGEDAVWDSCYWPLIEHALGSSPLSKLPAHICYWTLSCIKHGRFMHLWTRHICPAGWRWTLRFPYCLAMFSVLSHKTGMMSLLNSILPLKISLTHALPGIVNLLPLTSRVSTLSF